MNTRYKSLVFFAMMILLLGPAVTSAQSISNYAFSTGATASLNRSDGSLIDDIDMSIGTTVLVGGSQGNFSSTATPIGFDFYINGLRQTTFNATSNGWVGLGTTATPATGWLAGSGIKLAPFLGVNASTMGTSSIGRVHYKLIGSQPSRILVVEFLRMAINTSVVDDTTTFQVRLYENSGAIEYVYGRMSVTTGAPVSFNTGFQFSTTAYQSVNVTTHTSSTTSSTLNTFTSNGYITSLNSLSNGSRRSYKWVPSPPEDIQNITFPSVTSSSVTLNWTDASDELNYALYRSTDGGVNYTFVTSLASNTTTFSQFSLTPNTTYNYRVYAIKESVSIPIDGGVTTLPPPKVITLQSGLWNDPATWLGGALPQPGDSVEIAVGHTVQINSIGLSCGILEVNGTLVYSSVSTGNLTVNGNVIVSATGNFNAGSGTSATHVLNIGGSPSANNPGSLIVNGTFSMNTTAKVQVTFGGIQDASISGTSVCEFANIVVNKGTSNAATLEAVSAFTQQAAGTGVASRITVTAGTFKISSAVNITPFANNITSTFIAANGRLWLNHASAVLNAPAQAGTSTLTVSGELRIDQGNMTIGSGANVITFPGTLRLNGGKLTVLGSLAATSVTSNIILNGGDLDLDPQATSNLSQFTSIVNIGANATVNWSSGTITILDPHSTFGGTSFAILAGGSKLITGGTLKIGNGNLTNAGGTGNTGGFLINSAFTLNNLVVDNDALLFPSSSKMLRIINGLTVNNLTVQPGGYVFVGNNTTGTTLKVLNTLVNHGAVAGTEPGGVQKLGELIFEGSTAQTVSGSGNFDKLALVTVNNAAGVSFATMTATIEIGGIKLISGPVTPSSSFFIGTSTTSGTVQIGGISESGTNGRFTSVPNYAVPPTIIYGPVNGTMTFRSYNEIGPSSTPCGSITIADAEGLVASEPVLTAGLVLNGGNLNMGAFDLTVGLNATDGGTIIRNTGMAQFTTGTFFRWYAPGQTLNNDYNTGFPMLFGTMERSVLFQSSGALTTGGLVWIKHITSSGTTDLTPGFTDGGISINRRADASWQLGSGINVSGGSISVKLIAQNIGSVTLPADLRMIKANVAAPGTSINGGGTTTRPDVSRSFSSADITAGALSGTYYVGSNSSVNPLSPTIVSIASGPWNVGATWEGGVVPTAANNVMIASGHTVTVAGTNICNGLTILSGGTLTAATGNLNIGGSVMVDGTMNVSGSNVAVVSVASNGITVSSAGVFSLSSGTITLGPSGGSNRTFLLQGTATVSGGTLNINGNMSITSTAAFTQSGGDINIDGNAGVAASSVIQGTNLLNINTNNLNCSAGTITIVDPPHNSYPVNTTMALRITAAASTTAFSGSHTVRFGDGSSTETGNANGFVIDTKRNGVMPLQNVVVNAGNGSGRWVSTSYSTGSFGTHIKGTLTVNTGSEFRHTTASQLAIGGDIVNNGTLTIANNMTFGGIGYVVTNNVAISGSGIFRNSTGTSTGAFASVSLDLGAGNALTLSTSNTVFGFSGTLAPGVNNIVTGNNTIQINNGGALTITSGYIVGRVSRYMAAGSNVQRTFDIGSTTNYLPVIVTMPAVTTGGYFTAGISGGEHPQIASSCLNTAKNINRFWTLENNVAGSSPATVVFNFVTGDVEAGTNLAAAKAFTYNGISWVGGTTGLSTSNTFQVSNFNQYGDIAIGEITPVPASVTISTPNTTICSGTSVTFTATPTNGGTAPTYQWKVNGNNVGTGGNTYTTTTLANSDAVTCELTSNSGCVTSPVVLSNSIAMTVDAPTVAGSVSGGSTICSGSPVGNLTLAGNTGGVVRWESAAPFSSTWTSITNTTTTYNPGAITASTQYRAIVKNGTCPEANATATVVNVDAPSVGGSISSSRSPMICTGTAPGDLTVADYTGNIVRWETSVAPFTTWTTINHTNATYNPGVLSVDHQYRAVIKNGQCAETTSLVYQIFISPLSVGGAVSGGTNICSGANSGTLTLSGYTGDILRWEYAADPFTDWWSNTNSTNTFSLPNLTATTRVRAVVQSGPCPAATATFTTVTVDPASVGGTINGTNSICTGNNPGNLTLSGHTGTITRWESSVAPFTTWNSISNTTTTLNPGVLTATTQYRAVVQSGTCTAANSAVFTINVSSATVAGSVTGGSTICSGSTGGTLTLNGSNGNVVNWESSVAPFTTWTTIANTTTSLNVGALSATTQYRAVVQNGACASATSTSTTITVNPPSAGGSVTGGSTICSGSTGGTLTLSGETGNVVRWESSVSPFTTWTTISNTTNTLVTGTITATTQFRAVVQSGSCASANSGSTTVTVTPAAVGGTVTGGSAICSGSTAPTLTLSGETGSVIRWESSVSPFTTWTPIANTTNTLAPGTLTATTQFRAVVQNASCTPANSSTTTVSIVAPSVGGTVAGGSSVCPATPAGNLTLSGETGSVVRWESSVSPFTTWTTISNTTNTLSPGAPSETTQFRAVVQSGSCASANSATATVTVLPGSVGGTVSGGSTICPGSPAGNLTLSGETGSITRWESSVAPFTTWTPIANTTNTLTPGAITETTQFRAVVRNGSCASTLSSIETITVTSGTVAGTIGGTAQVCSGTSTTLTLSGHSGSVVRWESSVSPFTSWTTIANTTTTLNTGAITAETRYRAVVQNGTCSASNTPDYAVTTTAAGVWLGIISEDWNDPGNWCGPIPTSTTDVIISSTAPNQPRLVTNGVCRNLTMLNVSEFLGAPLSVLSIYGDIITNTSNVQSLGSFQFAGNANHNVPALNLAYLLLNTTGSVVANGDITVLNSITFTNGKLLLGSNTLTLSSPGWATGGSASSYIVVNEMGRVNLRNIPQNVPVVVPFGKATSYMPITINNNFTSLAYITTGILDGVYTSYTGETPQVGTNINASVVNSTYIIKEMSGGSINLGLTFQWNASDELTMNRAQTIVGNYSGGAWNKISGVASAASGSNPYTFSLSSVTAQGIFAIGDVTSPLPVKLLGFGAVKQKDNVLVTWATASEVNNSHFEIERSVDGKNFEKAGEVKGAGNSSSRINYNFTDLQAKAAFAQSKVVYYRLKQVDLNGDFTYSSKVAVSDERNKAFEIVSVVPNPFDNQASVSFISPSTETMTVEVIDAFGKLVFENKVQPIEGTNLFDLSGTNLQSGVYFVRLTQAGETLHVKVVRQ